MNDTVSSFAEGAQPMDFIGFQISAFGQDMGPVRKGAGMCPRCLARRFEDPRGRPLNPLHGVGASMLSIGTAHRANGSGRT